MIHSTWLPVLLGLLGLCYGLQCPKQKISPGREVVCYTSVSDVDKLTEAVCKCTTLVQQGHNVKNLSISEFEDFRKSLKEVNPAIQFAISVDDPGQTLRTSGTVRQEITARLMGVLKEVDGIELNMTAGSKERLVHFVKGLKNEMVRKSYDTRIFMVLPTKPEGLAKQFDLKELSKYVDLFTIPTHYLVEDDEAYRTFHPSRLMGLFDMFNADSLIDLISGLGVPKRKILVSLPSNAYEFTLKDQDDNAPRAPTEDMQPVIIDQKQLCDLMNQGEWTVERDEDLTAPYAFKNKTWIAFEDKISVSIKGKYALIRDLPGLAVRDIENDTETKCGKPLTHEVNHSFMDFKRKTRAAVLDALEDDLHQTQLSYPTKVRSSDFRVVRVVDTEGHIRAVRENTQTEFVCSRQGYFVHPKSCNRFYRCVKFNQEIEDYSVFEFDCPAGLAFDETTEVCVWPGSLSQGSPCPGSSEIAPVARVRFECPSTPGYYADPQNPRWFFACIDLGGPHMMAYEFRCPFGLIFDEHKLICEWPWLVEGYSGSGYTRVEYAYGGSGTGTTAGTGGYYTGALPHGFTGSTGGYQGGYKGQGGSVYQSGSEYQGGSGYKGGSSQGTTGYQGGVYGSSGAGSAGTIGAGSVYTGSVGVGYTGSGHAGNGYTVSVGGSQESAHGQGSTGYSGNAGGYAGSTTGHGYSGGATGIYSGSTGKSVTTGYYEGSKGSGSGSVDTGRYGSTSGSAGTGYTGSGSNVWTGAGAGQTSTGSGSSVYGGATGTAQVHTGTGYTGGTGTGGIYSGATGTGYTGSTFSAGQGVSGTSYTGSSDAGYQGSGVHGGSGTSYTGSTDTGYKGSGIYGGSGTSYTGTTGTGYQGSGVHVASGTGYTGSSDTGYKGSGVHGGSGTSYTGTTSTGYQGSGVHGASGTGYTGSSDTGYKGSGVHGGSGTSYTGSTGTGYQGSGVHGASGTGYTGSSDTGYKGSGTGNAGSTAGGYQKATGGAQVGTGISYTGSTAGGYQGSTGGIHGGSGISYTGTTAGEYQGSTGGVHGGSGISYTGSTDTGYKGSGVYGGSGTNYVGSTAGGYQKPTGGVQVGSGISYTGSTAGEYQGTTGGVHGGSGIGYTIDTTGEYQGPTGGIHGGSGTVYTGSTASGYQETDVHGGSGSVYTVAPTGGYQGSNGGAHGGSGISYTGSTASGYQETDVHGGSGSVYTVAPTGGYQGSNGGAHGGSGISYTGSTASGYQETDVHGGSGSVYTVAPTGGYQVSTGGAHGGSGTVYVGSTAGGLAGGSKGSVQGGYGGSTGTAYSGFTGQGTAGGVKGGSSYGSTSSGSSAGVDYSAGQTGTKYSGYDVTGHGGSTQTFGISGSGVQYTGTTGNDVQVPVSTYVQKPDGPRYNCITCSTTQAPSGQTYVTDGYLISHGASGSGSTVYQGSNGYSSNTTLVGGRVPSGGPVYHITPGDYGFGEGAGGSTILTGHDAQGSIVTGVSSPGTLVTYGQSPGSVLPGSSQQGTVVTGGTYPGYSQTGTGTSGYVVSGGVKTVYPGSVNQGTIVYGTQSPGVVVTGAPGAGTFVKGQTGPGIVVSGQTTPGLSIGSTVQPVTVTGQHGFGETGYTTQQGGLSTGFTYGTKIGKVPTTTGYKTNEYHDNGGRGTIRFNNGDVTTKYTENDIPDYRPAGGTIVPDTLIGGGVSGASTPRGFSKTGPTKTGYTAATLGAGGSYVVGSVKSRPTPRPENIGEKAFEGNVAGYTKSSTTESSVKVYTSSDRYPSTGRIDTSKITLGPSKSSGYSYPVPDVPFVTGVTSPVGSLSPTEGNVFTATTPTPYLNVEVYNTPKYTSSTPVVSNNYQKSTGFGHGTSTVSPLFTTGPLENYKTTAFEAAKIPVVTSTLRPVIDTGYKTIISSTPVPVTIGRDQFNVNVQTGSGYDKTQFAYGTKSTQQGGYNRKDYVSGTASSSVFEVPSSRRPQTQYVPSSTISPAIGVTYRKPFTISTVTPAVSSGSYFTGSPTNLNVPGDETGKLITGYRGTTKYVPSQYDVYSSGSIGESSSSSFEQGYSSTSSPVQKTQFAVGTYSGGYSKPSLTYQSTAKSTAVGGGRVIVKWSDLHPLLLGKLGAECTCRGDPFANLRGPGSKLINSSKGKVDLSNYDESDIYVDLEKDDSSERSDFVTSQESLSTGPIKIWNEEVAAKLSSETQIQQKPSSTYLPGVTSSVNLGVRSNLASSSQNLIGESFSHGFTANYRSGKSLNVESSSNPAADKQKLLDQFASFGDSEEVIDGAANCARPGLFRHPNFCNKFYACHWDEWKKKFTLHMFNCPVHLTFDNGANACNWPSMGPACQDDNLLV